MLARPHPCLGWLHISPADTSRVMDRLLTERDAALEVDQTFSGMSQSFIDWTWHKWLPSHLHRYEKQVEAEILYLDSKIVTLNQSLTDALVVFLMTVTLQLIYAIACSVSLILWRWRHDQHP